MTPLFRRVIRKKHILIFAKNNLFHISRKTNCIIPAVGKFFGLYIIMQCGQFIFGKKMVFAGRFYVNDKIFHINSIAGESKNPSDTIVIRQVRKNRKSLKSQKSYNTVCRCL